MGTQGPGRKRTPNREKLTAEDDALNQIAREAEARLAAKRAARAEARDIRMKELERQQKELSHSHKEDSERYSRPSRRHASMSDDEERMSVGSRGSLRPSDYSGFFGSGSRTSSRASSARASPVVEERPDRDFADKGSRTASTLSAATLASLGGASSRRGSCDTSFSVETEASIRDMKDSLAESEEKYRKAMVSIAQLHNEKSALMYQVETLKEELGDTEELLWESRRHCDDRSKECERERQAHRVLQFQFKEMEETLRQAEALLTEVSELRMKSSSYCQEVSDLQEVLQWKEKKMAALERQREISDIVRIERDRLRDEVVRLRDLLKEHGVVVTSPEVSTNGETGQGEAEDDVSAETASRLAQEMSPAGRESMLGKVRKQQPAEGSELPQDDRKYNRCSQSRNAISTGDQTKMEALKQVKGFVEQAREQTEKQPRRNKNARKLPRNRGSEKDPTKKFDIRRQGKTLFTKQPMEIELGTCEPKSSVARFIVVTQDNSSERPECSSERPECSSERPECSSERPECSSERPECSSELLECSSGLPECSSGLLECSSGLPECSSELLECSSGLPECCFELPECSSERPECNDQTDTSKSSIKLVPGEMWKDWSSLKNKIRSMLKGFVEKQSCAAKISRKFPDVPESLNRWISDFVDLAAEDEVPLEDLTAGSKRTADPESEAQSAAGHSTIVKDRSVSEMFEVASLEVHPQTYPRKVCEDVQEPRASADQDATGSTSGGIPRMYNFSLKVTESSPEETPGANSVDIEDEKQSQSDPAVMSWSEEIVFVEFYFAEPAKPKRVPVEEVVETQLSRRRTLSTNSQSSTVKRLLEMTADEIKAMAVPELLLMSLQEGIIEDQCIVESKGSTAEDQEELSVGDLDSCEEAAAMQQQPAVEAVVGDVSEASSVKNLSKRRGFGLRSRKYEHKTDCKIS
ncbi:uncharacterized protein lrrfip1b isoform X4 [Sander lucioperca]|uniref:uncharacterized protein lrrfip1b isoform X4 n=1 Tax=Sander lucioperca TaxID=283035 RepID=UPI001653D498|nr:uncharacterized protein lrrfip1b isoform X4 [Sander lucioperca]